jgi:ribose-phosphate pyrophosphokinase
VLVGQAFARLATPTISSVVVTDTIPGGDRLKPIQDRLTILSVARLLGEAVRRIHHDQSVSAMFREGIGVKR